MTDYVLTQPPVHTGPPQPPPTADRAEAGAARGAPTLPVVADFLKAAADHYRFVPQRPKSTPTTSAPMSRLPKASGLNREQIVRIYAFETGGNGTYDVQSGLTHNPKARAISTALGYNQLLTTNSGQPPRRAMAITSSPSCGNGRSR